MITIIAIETTTEPTKKTMATEVNYPKLKQGVSLPKDYEGSP
jgi:hypothetical protein